MSRRSAAESVATLFLAFLEHRTWRQNELAERVGISVKALRKRLDELDSSGLPLERQEDEDDRRVYWSVPAGWLPGAAALSAADVAVAIRLLLRLPATRARNNLLEQLAAATRAQGAAQVEIPLVDDSILCTLEDAAAKRTPVKMNYFTASTGGARWRQASVHRIVQTPRPRFIATCHERNELRWFRADRVHAVVLDGGAGFRDAPRPAIDAFAAMSVDGYKRDDAVNVAFTVQRPEANWVGDSLPAQLRVEATNEGIRVSGITAGVLALARFVVGLGASARPETPELAAEVLKLARGALSAAAAPLPLRNAAANRTRARSRRGA